MRECWKIMENYGVGPRPVFLPMFYANLPKPGCGAVDMSCMASASTLVLPKGGPEMR